MDTHPAWLKKSNIPLTIVCGPPCGGKSTYVRSLSTKGDIVIDLDTIRRKLNPRFRAWSGREDSKLLHRAIKVRNMMLANLAFCTSGCAWFIIAAPTQKERLWWQGKLGGEVVVLNPGTTECMRRAYARGTPLAVAGARAWVDRSELDWSPPRYRRAIHVDGWFMDEDSDEADVEIAKALAM